MQITNEEMEVLNRASEILSKYADQGGLSKEDFNYYERMVIAIIDGITDNNQEGTNGEKSIDGLHAAQKSHVSRFRIDDNMFQRDRELERTFGIEDIKLYGYYDDSRVNIVGEIISSRINKSFCIVCTIFDREGDIIDTDENWNYGSGLVTNIIVPQLFFSRFPFKISFLNVPRLKISHFRIIPSED